MEKLHLWFSLILSILADSWWSTPPEEPCHTQNSVFQYDFPSRTPLRRILAKEHSAKIFERKMFFNKKKMMKKQNFWWKIHTKMWNFPLITVRSNSGPSFAADQPDQRPAIGVEWSELSDEWRIMMELYPIQWVDEFERLYFKLFYQKPSRLS